MPMHNSSATVASSIASVQGQTFDDWEIIVVNDFSTDSSPEMVAEIAAADPRIRLLHNTGERGAAHARNVAIKYAEGRYIAFLDSDDLWLPTKLDRQLEHLQATGGPISYSWYVKVDGDADVNAATFVADSRIVRSPARLAYKQMLRQDYIGFLTAIYDTEVVGKCYFPPLQRRQDYAMLLEIMRAGHEAHGVMEPLAVYRAARSGSLSSNKFKAARYNWHIYRHVEGLSLPRAVVAFCNYAVRSTYKYFI